MTEGLKMSKYCFVIRISIVGGFDIVPALSWPTPAAIILISVHLILNANL